MRSPLALLEVQGFDGEMHWVPIKTSASARGCAARRVIFIRNPTPEERQTVERCLFHPDAVGQYQLDQLLQTA